MKAATIYADTAMTFLRPPPPPPPPASDSVLLLRTVGDLLRARDTVMVDVDAVAAAMGREPAEITALIGRGRAAAYLASRESDVWLTRQGQTWYQWDRQRRS
jgi:hypothetical protein